jgi:hypothetical protein
MPDVWRWLTHPSEPGTALHSQVLPMNTRVSKRVMGSTGIRIVFHAKLSKNKQELS